MKYLNACAILLLMGFSIPAFAAAPVPPMQPTSGPGGSGDYIYAGYNETDQGTGSTEVWLFEPQGAPDNIPVVVFLHGFGAMDPTLYLGWINHLVRRGNIVIYPRYQASSTSNAIFYTPDAITAIQNALATLQTSGHVKPDLTRFSFMGHSFGGVIASNIAVLASANSLPAAKALLVVHPGSAFSIFQDYSKIPNTTLVLCVAGSDDTVVGSAFARYLYDQTSQIPAANKDFVLVRSDSHGSPALVTQHGAPTAGANNTSTDALDWYGYWKFGDALPSAAESGTYGDYALGNTANQRYMGLWSDAVPVIQPVVTDTPDQFGQLQFGAAAYSVKETAGVAAISVTRTGGSSGPVSVAYATSDGTGVAGMDYVATSGNVSFADGESGTKSFNITILNDGANSQNTTVNLALSTPTGGAILGALAPGIGLGSQTVVLTINNASNHPPTASNSTVSTVRNTAVNLVLNAADVDGDALTYTILSGAAHGALTGTAPNLTYTPANRYTGSDSFTFKVNDGQADSGTATVSITIGRLAATVNSPLSATPNPANLLDTLNFAVHASDPAGDAVTYTWNFGDGAILPTDSNASETHAYAVAGVYAANVTIVSVDGSLVTSQTTITVNADNGSGSSGGSGSGNGGSGGTGGAGGSGGGSDGSGGAPAPSTPMTVSKMRGVLNFKTSAHDTAMFNGLLPTVSSPFFPSGQVLTISLGGQSVNFTLNNRGQGKANSSFVALKLKSNIKSKTNATPGFQGGSIPFTAKIANGSWASDWGVDPAQTTLASSLTIPITVQLADVTYAETVTLKYSAKANTLAKFKQ